MGRSISQRNFSTPIDPKQAVDAKPDDQSIFASADYFKDVKPDEMGSS